MKSKNVPNTYRRTAAVASVSTKKPIETERAMLRRVANLAKSKQTRPAIAR